MRKCTFGRYVTFQSQPSSRMGESRKTRRQASGEGSNRLRSGPMGQVKDLKLDVRLSKAVKKLSKSYQKAIKKLSKSCQKAVKKLSKSQNLSTKSWTQPAQLRTAFSLHLTNHKVLPTAKKCILIMTEDLPSYMTLASRIGSMGGLVACANSCEK